MTPDTNALRACITYPAETPTQALTNLRIAVAEIDDRDDWRARAYRHVMCDAIEVIEALTEPTRRR